MSDSVKAAYETTRGHDLRVRTHELYSVAEGCSSVSSASDRKTRMHLTRGRSGGQDLLPGGGRV